MRGSKARPDDRDGQAVVGRFPVERLVFVDDSAGYTFKWDSVGLKPDLQGSVGRALA